MTATPSRGRLDATTRMDPDHLKLGGMYWRLWWANAVNSVGDGAFVAALSLLAVTVTTDARAISIIAAVAYLPWLLLSLPAGVIVDRYDRATLMWRCQAGQAAIVAGVAVATVTGHVSIPLLAAASFLLGSAQVVIANAAQSALPQYVPVRLLPRANGNQYVAQTLGGWVLGPPVGSVLFVAAAALPFGLDAASFVLSAALLATLPRRPAQRTEHTSMRGEVSEGLRWLRGHRLLRTLAVMLGMNTFCQQMGFATLVLFATQTLHLGSRDYGLVLVGGGLGGIVGGLINSRVAQWLGPLPALAASYVASAILYIAAGLAANGAVLAVLFAAGGIALTLINVVTVSLRQQIVPQELLGRVNSVYRMLGWGLMPLGGVAGGLVAHRFGLRAPLLGAGAIRFAVIATTLPFLIAIARRPAAGRRTTTTGSPSPRSRHRRR
jgi:MFS family permease